MMEKMQDIIGLLDKSVLKGKTTYREFLDSVEISVFIYALTKANGCVSEAARLLKMKRSTLEMRLLTLRKRNDYRFSKNPRKMKKAA